MSCHYFQFFIDIPLRLPDNTKKTQMSLSTLNSAMTMARLHSIKNSFINIIIKIRKHFPKGKANTNPAILQK